MVIGAAVTTVHLAQGEMLHFHPFAITVIWGACAVVSATAIIFGIVTLRHWALQTSATSRREAPPEPRANASSTAFMDSASSFRERSGSV
jgi:hypothetical protein